MYVSYLNLRRSRKHAGGLLGVQVASSLLWFSLFLCFYCVCSTVCSLVVWWHSVWFLLALVGISLNHDLTWHDRLPEELQKCYGCYGFWSHAIMLFMSKILELQQRFYNLVVKRLRTVAKQSHNLCSVILDREFAVVSQGIVERKWHSPLKNAKFWQNHEKTWCFSMFWLISSASAVQNCWGGFGPKESAAKAGDGPPVIE